MRFSFSVTLLSALALAATPTLSFQRPIGTSTAHRSKRLASSMISPNVVAFVNDFTTPINAIVQEADRAFQVGIRMEKSGLPRPASAAFHEAATLYQCFLDSADEFGHVTSLPREDVPSILAYACVRLAHLSHDALGDPRAASRLFRAAEAIDLTPSAVSFDGLGNSIEASGGSLKEAAAAYRKAHELVPKNRYFVFHLAVALERLGETEEAERLLDQLRKSETHIACLVDSWGYIRWHTRKLESPNLHRGTRDMIQLALFHAASLIDEGGLVCEFGVASGRSLRMTQELLPLSVPIHGFDTFTGLPQAWGPEPAGTYSTGGVVPEFTEGNVQLHQGLFAESIPAFLKTVSKDQFLAYANIDCDLYSSTVDILEKLHARIVPGTVLLFDEYLGHSTWRQDEFRAWRECCRRFGWQYEYIGFSLGTKQTVVRVTDVATKELTEQ
jgi:tetratricopeptide (TPR) repeat protein